MKIRAIELTNLRRFAGQRARIDGIGDGISMLSQPNEFGKSTFFDGLHALFFQPHRSARAPVKALQPHVGGAPEVAVEIALREGHFRVEKRWLSRPTARILDASGRLIAQEDEAEAWIDRLIGQGLAGPSGLVWVRQGVLGMEPEGAGAAERSERERALSARRDVLSSVAGEIEMMTGGRRMDQVLARVNDALAKLATTTLRPKAGGEWARAVDEAATLAARLDQAQRGQLALAARDRAASLVVEYDRAERQRAAAESHRADRSLLKITRALLDQAEKAQAARDRLALQDEARLVSVCLSYQGEARVMIDARPLPADGIRLRTATMLDLPGIGRMTIDPGPTAASDLAAQITRADETLARALATCAVPDIATPRKALAEAERLETAIRQADDLLKELAPHGIAALQTRLAEARAAAEGVEADPGEDPAQLQDALRIAREAEAAALTQRREAEARHATLRETRAACQAALLSAEQALASVQAEAGDAVELAAHLQNLSAAQPALAKAEAEAAGALARLTADAPDLATAQAAVSRLRSVVEGRQRDLAQLKSDLAGVNGSIGALADEGIEETLDELRGREASATARAERYGLEVKSLARLRSALEDTRRAAREAYFGPVLREIDPLLSILHPGAALRIDDASLLPAVLTRDGQDETLDILSGGTREQLAILTRLAFARLFARSGRPVPVILDDALVHSDDDRIEAMFTALHRVAQDQQILVLTCRQRAFASLGGARLNVQITAT